MLKIDQTRIGILNQKYFINETTTWHLKLILVKIAMDCRMSLVINLTHRAFRGLWRQSKRKLFEFNEIWSYRRRRVGSKYTSWRDVHKEWVYTGGCRNLRNLKGEERWSREGKGAGGRGKICCDSRERTIRRNSKVSGVRVSVYPRRYIPI